MKQAILRSYAQQYPVTIFVETGTLYGDMTEAMCRERRFGVLHTIELDPSLAAAARERFRAHPQILVHQGDSGVILPALVAALPPNVATLFWLDGHYSGEGTARGDIETPIRRELETILIHECTQHVILIDDARHFVGVGDYPTIDEITRVVHALRPSAGIRVADDVIRITPDTTTFPRQS